MLMLMIHELTLGSPQVNQNYNSEAMIMMNEKIEIVKILNDEYVSVIDTVTRPRDKSNPTMLAHCHDYLSTLCDCVFSILQHEHL